MALILNITSTSKRLIIESINSYAPDPDNPGTKTTISYTAATGGETITIDATVSQVDNFLTNNGFTKIDI